MTERELRKRKAKRNMISNPRYEDDRESRLEKKVKRRKRFRLGLALGFVIAIFLAALIGWLLVRFLKYKSFELKNEVEMSQGSYIGFERYGDNAVKYSHDGATYIDKSGKELWVDTYEMKDPEAYVSGDYLCIYDTNGNQINIYGKDGLNGICATTLPITKAVVSETGVCAAVVEDTEATYIKFFKKDGSELDISIKTLLKGDGYPVDIALSPDGTQLIVAYEYVDSGQFKGKVVFYDFSEIGKNVPNRLVAGFDEPFENSMIARARFVNSIYSYAAADTGLYIFSSKNLSSPELIKEIPVTTTIKTIFNCKDHVGIIYENEASGVDEEGNPTGSDQAYHLALYKANGEVELEKDFSYQFKLAQSDGRFIYLIDDRKLIIYNLAGTEKYNGEIANMPEVIASAGWPGRFIFTGSNFVREYQFR